MQSHHRRFIELASNLFCLTGTGRSDSGSTFNLKNLDLMPQQLLQLYLFTRYHLLDDSLPSYLSHQRQQSCQYSLKSPSFGPVVRERSGYSGYNQ